jgi:hypothetical protein
MNVKCFNSPSSLLLFLQEAVKLKPSFADAYLNQGNVYKVKFSTKILQVNRGRALILE